MWDFWKLQESHFFFVALQKIHKNMKDLATNLETQASYEAYLNDLFVQAVTMRGTPTKSINEILLARALLYGRAVDEAKEDTKHVLNVLAAVKILLKNAAHPRDD